MKYFVLIHSYLRKIEHLLENSGKNAKNMGEIFCSYTFKLEKNVFLAVILQKSFKTLQDNALSLDSLKESYKILAYNGFFAKTLPVMHAFERSCKNLSRNALNARLINGEQQVVLLLLMCSSQCRDSANSSATKENQEWRHTAIKWARHHSARLGRYVKVTWRHQR